MERVRDFICKEFCSYLKINNEWASDLNERLTSSDMDELLEEVIIGKSTYTREDGRVIKEINTISKEKALIDSDNT